MSHILEDTLTEAKKIINIIVLLLTKTLNMLNSTQLCDFGSRNYHFPTLFPSKFSPKYRPISKICFDTIIGIKDYSDIHQNNLLSLGDFPIKWCKGPISIQKIVQETANWAFFIQVYLPETTGSIPPGYGQAKHWN